MECICPISCGLESSGLLRSWGMSLRKKWHPALLQVRSALRACSSDAGIGYLKHCNAVQIYPGMDKSTVLL
eukprot:15333008-Ditylum_brightwellii.AAC.1